MTRLVIYIAGPYRASDNWQIENNCRRAEALAAEVWKLGHAAICPHANTRFFQGMVPDEVFLEGDIAIVNRCDALLMTPEWNESAGARAERSYAHAHGIPVFYNVEELADWLSDAAE